MKLLAALMCFIVFFQPTAQANQHRGYIVKLKNEFRSFDQGYLQSVGVEVTDQIPQLRMLATDKNPLRQSLSATDVRVLNDIIEYVEPNYIRRIVDFVPQKPPEATREMTNTYNMKLINAPAAWQINTGSEDVIISISDSGVWQHSDLNENRWWNPGETGVDAGGKNKANNKIDDDGNGYVDDTFGWDWSSNTNHASDAMYHGTHVAGIAAARGENNMPLVGVTWKARLIAAKFLDRDGAGTDLGGIKSLIYSADMGAKVVNCSWGSTGFSQALADSIGYLMNKGVLVVAASGNSSVSTDKKPHFPSGYDFDNIISVASIDNAKGQLSFFSNWGPKTVDIGAPGFQIYSTWNPTWSSAYQYWYYQISGTSMAAPHVTGAIALLYSVNPKLTWKEAKEIILQTAAKAPKLKGKVLSEGILDVGAAVKLAQTMK